MTSEKFVFYHPKLFSIIESEKTKENEFRNQQKVLYIQNKIQYKLSILLQ